MSATFAVTLPALDGRDSLGFLAGLGVQRLIGLRHPARLAWDRSSGSAVLHSHLSTPDDIATELVDLFVSMRDDELLPSFPDALLPAKVGSAGSDPARISIAALHELYRSDLGSAHASLLSTFWTDLADDNDGNAARTKFNAPAGQQTLRSMFDKPREIVLEEPDKWLGEAISAWTRLQGYTGEGLDSRAQRDSAEVDPSPGKPSPTSYGVPGATLLALSALPYFPLSGNGVLARGNPKQRHRSRIDGVGWYWVPGAALGESPKRNVWAFAWPLWSKPLDEAAIRVVLDHPAVARLVRDAHRAASSHQLAGSSTGNELRPLGVWAVPVAVRRKSAAAKSEGTLTVRRILQPEA